jgi:hypothetical protein
LGATGHAARRRFEAIHDDEAAMLDGFKAMRASLEAMQQASGQGRGGWRFRGWFCARSTSRRQTISRWRAASARCDQATGSGRIRPTRLTERATC